MGHVSSRGLESVLQCVSGVVQVSLVRFAGIRENFEALLVHIRWGVLMPRVQGCRESPAKLAIKR